MSQIWLSLDLSHRQGSLALHDGSSGRLLGESDLEAMHSSEQLVPKLQQELAAHKIAIADISRYFTGIGPGSFTGLRTALATLKGFALPFATPIDTMNGAEARALIWLRDHGPLPSGEKLYVLTPIAAESIAVAAFSVGSKMEESIETGAFVPPKGAKIVDTALRARHFAEVWDQAQTRQRSQSREELVALVPRYFGASRFEK